MPVSPSYRPDPLFMALGEEFAVPVEPADFPKTILRFRNQRAAATVGLETLDDAEWLTAFARFEALPGNQPRPLAMRYHGHQFRHYNPDLGDGRGFLFAQMREAGSDRLLDLGTKGSGQTPYSRQGDGRLTLKGGVREVLATEMLEAQGVPTSRTFSLVETGEQLHRGDEPSPTRSAVLTRLSWSNVRFGTFQRHAYFGRADLIEQLCDHVIGLYYPEVQGEGGARIANLLAAITLRSARLAASWMAAGFVHGVLNTDNMNINGESFDYGPYRFLPKSDPEFTAAYFDQQGLYAFGRQPQTVFWNLQQLAGTLTLVADAEALSEALNGFGPAYSRDLTSAMLRRLNLKAGGEEADTALAAAAFKVLAEGGEALRWEPFFFDWFGGRQDRAMSGVRAKIYDGEAGKAFAVLVAGREASNPAALDHPYFQRAEPEELLYDEIEAIWARIADGDDWSALDAKVARIREAGSAYSTGSSMSS